MYVVHLVYSETNLTLILDSNSGNWPTSVVTVGSTKVLVEFKIFIDEPVLALPFSSLTRAALKFQILKCKILHSTCFDVMAKK